MEYATINRGRQEMSPQAAKALLKMLLEAKAKIKQTTTPVLDKCKKEFDEKLADIEFKEEISDLKRRRSHG